MTRLGHVLAAGLLLTLCGAQIALGLYASAIWIFVGPPRSDVFGTAAAILIMTAAGGHGVSFAAQIIGQQLGAGRQISRTKAGSKPFPISNG